MSAPVPRGEARAPLRVLINALSARQRGGQTYLKNLLALVPGDGSIEVLLLAPESLELGLEHSRVRRLPAPKALDNPFARAAWERVVLPGLVRRHAADVLFCPGGVVAGAPRGCKVVTMFRNMIPFDQAQRSRYAPGYDRFRNWLLHRVMLRSMVGADLVIFISDYARQVIERHAGAGRVRGVVIPHGIPKQFRTDDGRVGRAVAPWIGTRYLLYVSYVDVYKAQAEVVQAYALLHERHRAGLRLLLVGPENPNYGARVRAEIERLGLSGAVVMTGPLPYAELPALYRHATVNIFASESENCPNILLEALAAGRPVVSSSRPPMPEFAGDAVLYFDPSRPETLAAILDDLLDDDQAMRELGARAREQSQLYDWEVTARRTWEALRAPTAGASPAPPRYALLKEEQ